MSSNYWTKSVAEVQKEFKVNPDIGLSHEEVTQRQNTYGKNKLEDQQKRSKLSILIDQVKSILVIILIFAVIVSFLFGEYIEAVAITAVLIINTLIGFFTELKAVQSMEALRELVKTDARVIREGELQKINAEELVPGDIVEVEAGDIVSADLRLITSSKLRVDESALTGESVPVSKLAERIEDAPLAERSNMLYSGTSITRGTGKGIVIGIGQKTEVGKIADLIEEAGIAEETPLEQRLEELGKKLVWLSGIIILSIVVVGLIQGDELFLLFETAIALAVATVPEGLPIVATITLARGMKRMADNNALVNRLSSVETLGSTNVIATDKTGTLTENMMTVTKLILPNGTPSEDPYIVEISGKGTDLQGKFKINGSLINVQDHEEVKRVILSSVLCNNANINNNGNPKKTSTVGDPMEVALLVAGEKAGFHKSDLLQEFPEAKEISFDPSVMMMATYNKLNSGKYLISVKGSPYEVLNHCSTISNNRNFSDEDKKYWIKTNDDLASKGFRVLAVASKIVDTPETSAYSDLEFLGLVILLDPPRLEVKETIKQIQQAGINLVMITGDQKLTAVNIAEQLELSTKKQPVVMPGHKLNNYENLTEDDKRELRDVDIFYRVEPKEKLSLVKVYQDANQTIAMTGDGVNDAPALRKASIGVAMGLRGTQVAKQAADMILRDDDFSTIAKAIQEGRNIFKSIQKFVYYLLSCNISEIMVIFFATLLLLPLPILPIQILFLNIVTDVFPAFALSMNEGDRELMKNKPRKKSDPIITDRQWVGIGIYGMILTISVLAAFVFGLEILDLGQSTAVTMGFLTLGIAQVWHVFNMRDSDRSPVSNLVIKNKNVWYAVVISILLILITVYIPGFNTVMRTVPLSLDLLGIVFLFSLIPILLGLIIDKLDVK